MRTSPKTNSFIKTGALALLLTASQIGEPRIPLQITPVMPVPEGGVLPQMHETPKVPDTILKINPRSLVTFFNLGDTEAENGERTTTLELYDGTTPVVVTYIDTGSQYIGGEERYLYTINTHDPLLKTLSPYMGLPLVVGEHGVVIESCGERIINIPLFDIAALDLKKE